MSQIVSLDHTIFSNILSLFYVAFPSTFRYCQCFNAARVCNPLCRCTDCFNTDSNEAGRSEAVKIILDRNPSAFDSKFLSVSVVKLITNTDSAAYSYGHNLYPSVPYRPSNQLIKVDANVGRACA